RALNGEEISSDDVEPLTIGSDGYEVPLFWDFERTKVIPQEADLSNLRLTLGSHDPQLQARVNKFRPVGVFNLSITPPKVIKETHARMADAFHPDGGPWKREYMPRTT